MIGLSPAIALKHLLARQRQSLVSLSGIVLGVAFFLAVSLGGCAGYRIGEIKPQYLKDVHSIAVPAFKNNTFIPRIEALVTKLADAAAAPLASEQSGESVHPGGLRLLRPEDLASDDPPMTGAEELL